MSSHTRYSNVLGMSRIDLTPEDITTTGVRPNSVRSALMSKPVDEAKCYVGNSSKQWSCDINAWKYWHNTDLSLQRLRNISYK